MIKGTYILITSLNVKGSNATTKRCKMKEWIHKKIYMHIVYKWPTSDLQAPQTENEGIEKYFPFKLKSKES